MTALIPIPDYLRAELSNRTRNVLEREQIHSCQEVLALRHKDLQSVRGCGVKTVSELTCIPLDLLEPLVVPDFPFPALLHEPVDAGRGVPVSRQPARFSDRFGA